MVSFTLDDLQPLLDAFPAPALLFQDDTLLQLNLAALRLQLPLKAGMSAGELFPAETLSAFRFDGPGSRMLTEDFLGQQRELCVTQWHGFRLVTLSEQPYTASQAFSSVAQGILAPLTSMMAVTPELLRRITEDADEKVLNLSAQLNQGLYTIFRASSHLRMCSDLRQLHIAPRNENICRWLSMQSELLKPLISHTGRTLNTVLPMRDYICQFDPEKLSQALFNLVSNALKFTEPDGHITLELKKTSASRLCIVVRDDGCGIPPDQMSQIFRRSESPRDLPDPRWGIGLGLPLARAIMQQHGGALILESQEHIGTTVYLALRYTPGATEQPLRSSVLLPSPSSGFSTALVELADALPDSIYDFRNLDG